MIHNNTTDMLCVQHTPQAKQRMYHLVRRRSFTLTLNIKFKRWLSTNQNEMDLDIIFSTFFVLFCFPLFMWAPTIDVDACNNMYLIVRTFMAITINVIIVSRVIKC